LLLLFEFSLKHQDLALLAENQVHCLEESPFGELEVGVGDWSEIECFI
jgi:hypothetical protein